MNFRLSVFLLFAASSVFAQTGVGIKGGINLSGVQTDNLLLLQNKSKIGWQAGVFSKSVNDGWGYLIEGNVIAMGSKQQVSGESQENTVGYLSIPLALQYMTETNWGFYLGGYASFRLWAKRKTIIVGSPDTEANISDNISFMDYGVLVGINYTYERFIFDLRFQQGIPDISIDPTINVRANNVGGQFSIAYFLK